MIAINKTPSPADLAAQELVDHANLFLANLDKVLTNGSAAEGTRPMVPPAQLQASLGNACAKLKALVAAGA